MRIQIDEKAITRYMTTDLLPQAALKHVADQYMEAAREATPRGRSVGKFMTKGKGAGRQVIPLAGTARHGWSRYAFHVRPFRGGFRVWNRSKWFHLVEYGSENSPVYAPMRRALLAFKGGRVNAAKTTGVRAVEGQHTL